MKTLIWDIFEQKEERLAYERVNSILPRRKQMAKLVVDIFLKQK